MRFCILDPHAVRLLEQQMPAGIILGWDPGELALRAYPPKRRAPLRDRRRRRLAAHLDRALEDMKRDLIHL